MPHPLPAARSRSLFLSRGTRALSGRTGHQQPWREHARTQALQSPLSEIRAEMIHRHEAARPPGSARAPLHQGLRRHRSSTRDPPAPVLPVLLLLMLVTPRSASAGRSRGATGGPGSPRGASLPVPLEGGIWQNTSAALSVAAVSSVSINFGLHVAKAVSIKRTGLSVRA